MKRFLFLLTILIPTLVFSAGVRMNTDVTIEGPLNQCDATGSANTYTCNLNPALEGVAYRNGFCATFKANAGNTAAATINYNSIGAVAIKKMVGGVATDLASGDICTGMEVRTCYDNTIMQMQNPVCNTVTSYTDEQAQDAVGNILTDTSSIDFTYNDAANTISAVTINDSSIQKVEVTKNNGAVVGTRKQLNFVEGSNVTLTIADDSGNNQVDITIASSGGASGIANIDGQTGSTLTVTRGAGIGGSSSGNDLAFTTASGEANFLSSGVLTCGAGTQGKAQVHTTPLQYCDNATTPALQYAAYGDPSGNATSVANDSVALGTKTTGNYVLDVTVGTGLSKTSSASEGQTVDLTLDSDLSALATNSTNGMWSRTGTGTGSARTITGTGSNISVTNGDGVSGNPTIDVGSNIAKLDTSNTWADGIKQTFNPNATNAGINVGSQAGDPSTLVNGDLWYNSTNNTLGARINGSTIALGSGSATPGGSNPQVQYNNSGSFGGSSANTYDASSKLTEVEHCTALSADTTLGTHLCVYMTTSTTNKTLTLPAASSGVNARIYKGYKIDSASGALCLAPNGTNTLNGVNATICWAASQYSGYIVKEASATDWLVEFSINGPFSVNAQTATYTATASDFSSFKTITVASGTFTITLPINTSQPANGQSIRVINYGSGVVTIARNGQNLNGGTTSFTLPAGTATAPTSAWIVSDGTNYFALIIDVVGNTTVVRNNAANTWSAGAQDMGSAASLKVPTSAGAGPTASGNIAYDSTSNTLEVGVNGSNAIIATNPMTAAGDFIYGGTSGTPTRLAAGTGFLYANGSSSPTISKLARALSFTIGDPAGSALTVASTTTDYLTVPFGCTISAYNLLVDAGTVTVKFWKVATGTAIPTSSNSINTSGVGISTGTAIHSTTILAGDFTTATVTANDIMAMNVTAVSTAKYVQGVLQCDQ